MDDMFGVGFSVGAIGVLFLGVLAIQVVKSNYDMHYKLVDEYCGEGSAVTYDVMGSDVGKRLMLTCEILKVAK